MLAVPLPDSAEFLETASMASASMWLTVSGLGFVAVTAFLAFSRGVLRQLVGMCSLALSVGVAWYVFRHRIEVFGESASGMSADRLLLFSAAAGLLTYFLCKAGVYVLSVIGLISLLGQWNGWKGMLLSALPSSFLMWVTTMALRLLGSIDGIESAAEVAKQGVAIQSQAQSLWTSLSQELDHSFIGALAQKFDPYDLKATANLSRLLILWPEGTMWRRLAAQSPKTAAALNHPSIVELGGDSKVRHLIEQQDFAGLMQLKQVEEAARHADLEPVLSSLDLEAAMDSVVYHQPQTERLH
jgi:hypothetical protein